jgi:hypothetical protein
MPKYQVLREATVTVAVTVNADSPEDAVRKGYECKHRDWKSLGDGMGLSHIDTVTEQRKNGKAYDVEYSHDHRVRCRVRCVEVKDEEW